MGRWIIAIIILMGSTVTALSQSATEKKADRLFERYSFLAAANKYEKIYRTDPDNHRVILQSARAYYQLRDDARTVYWYSMITDSTSLFSSEDMLHFGQALHALGKYQLAIHWYELYGNETGDMTFAEKLSSAKDLSQSFSEEDVFYTVAPLSVNSEQSDFSPIFYQEGLIFASARTRGARSKSFGWHEQSFIDLYYVAVGDSSLGEVKSIAGHINSPFHEGPATIINDSGSILFTRNNYNNGETATSQNGINKLQLFEAMPEGEKPLQWGKPVPFPYNSTEYSIGHPSYDSTRQILYFASDMPGGYGGTDIYYCHRTVSGWTKPKNVGPKVNTSGNDMFPFIHHSGTLYFSSDGHIGMGGLDVFLYDIESNLPPQNMGSPINSNRDDFGFITNKEKVEGYFSSNRTDLPGNDDIFHFYYHKPEMTLVNGVVTSLRDKTPLPGAVIKIFNQKGEDQGQKVANFEGYFTFELPWNENFLFQIGKNGFTSKELAISTDQASQEVDIELNNLMVVRGNVVQKQDGSPIGEATVELLHLSTNQKLQAITDSAGYFQFELEHEDRYLLTSRKEKFFSENRSLPSEPDQHGEIKVIVQLEEIVLNKAIELENIYYDLGKSDIREDAALELDKLVQLLKDNPSINIELSSHTDARGSDQFNLRLSDKRAKASVAYIVSQGIAAERIVGKGYGEQRLLNHCKNNVECSDRDHQQNRRTEFSVTKF